MGIRSELPGKYLPEGARLTWISLTFRCTFVQIAIALGFRAVWTKMAGDISLADTNTAGVVIFGLIMGASHFPRRLGRCAIQTRRPRSFPLSLT